MAQNCEAEGNENKFEKNLSVQVEIPFSRSILNAIPDPCQFSKEFLQEVVISNGIRDKSVDGGSGSNRRKSESAHTTPARSVCKTTFVGQLRACTGPRALQSTGDRVGCSSRVSRRISNVNCEPPPTEVPHFELVEDPSFWSDHNVQVLIRMRPLSNMEKMAQGYGRCLKQESLQTLAWLGHPEMRFTFDHIVSETISQEKLFKVAGLPMVDNCMSGYNSCMFAYGQTGSGKTYTMMGEISQQDGMFVDDCGITPRLFEYLFTRIKLEEENRRDERLKYSCKCSFLEIYNEQITDLLEPSSTNLQLREGLKEGVYVENLTECNVETVDQVLKLLLQGAANRKVAETDMNSESSRSHSVFTCIVESRWEKDSVTHLRFGRLNLVDLAGSERQRSSGAGERLKEASYINKSLSTLGLVIMSLVDVAHGKHRHVPYRDSRLTFLLQDSLGGNSKTTIIANVSPSMCAANETLSTLKFAQRAKLIQNNAKVNEDASGDVTALQRQIQMLKEQMSILMKHQEISKPMFQVGPNFQPIEIEESSGENICVYNNVLNNQKKKINNLENTLLDDSSGEKLTETIFSTTHSQTKQKKQLVESLLSSTKLGDKVEACDQVERVPPDNSGLKNANIIEELMDARALIDTMKSQQNKLIEELEHVRQENNNLTESLNKVNHSENGFQQNTDQIILNLQEELASLQVKYHNRLCTMSEENKKLKKNISVKEDEVYTLHSDWERASLELTGFLLDGSKSLKNASEQIQNISSSFPNYNVLVGENVKKAVTACIEKEETILQLEKNLVDAQSTTQQMQEKLNSLRNAAIALTEMQFTQSTHEIQDNQPLMVHQIITELVGINNKLDNVKDYFTSINEDLDECETDVSSSSSNVSDDEDMSENVVSEMGPQNSSDAMKTYLFLKNQFIMAYEAFIKLNVKFGAVFKDKEMLDNAAGCFTAMESVEEKSCKESNFFSKFEEARATINEADNMLNALMKANKEAKMISGSWKKAAEDLIKEKATLIEEINQLKSELKLKDDENRCSLVEFANSVSILEDSLQLTQKETEDLCHVMYSDALTMVKGVHVSISESISSLIDISAETMEKSFASFVVQQCRIGDYINKFGENNSMINGEKEVNYDLIGENVKLKKELERKTTLLNGLLFDLSLLQESTSTGKDIKDEAEKLVTNLTELQHELNMKTQQLDDMMINYEKLESCLSDTEAALSSTESCLQHSEETVDAISYQNDELRSLLQDLYHKNAETEKQLEEQKEIVKTLEKEIHSASSSAQEQFLFSLEGITDDLKRVSSERDELYEQINSLQDKLEMAYALADENEAIAVEARQESQACKIYAEQKEEEVKILEHSVEELDSTINVLEKRVNEMEEELERHHMIRDSLEVELQSVSQRLLTFESSRKSSDFDNDNVDQNEDSISRKLHSKYLELQEAQTRIKELEDETAEQANEMKQCKEYISELVIHAEAQAFQYQQKYKSLEAMISTMKIDSSKSVSEAPLTEKNSARTRGSSSPFRCIGNLVQQMSTEKDQEISLTKLRLQELELLASSRQKEICMLNTKLAATESMTHDVIRDLLGVKLDMTNYANLINHKQLQRFIEDAGQQAQEFVAMEQEIRRLKRQINDLNEERDRCISDINSKEADILASKMKIVQLQGRDHLLTAQNQMLKADKSNLQKKAADLDDMIKKLLGTQTQIQQHVPKACTSDFGKRLADSEKLLVRVNNELAQYQKPDSPRFHHRRYRKEA